MATISPAFRSAASPAGRDRGVGRRRAGSVSIILCPGLLLLRDRRPDTPSALKRRSPLAARAPAPAAGAPERETRSGAPTVVPPPSRRRSRSRWRSRHPAARRTAAQETERQATGKRRSCSPRSCRSKSGCSCARDGQAPCDRALAPVPLPERSRPPRRSGSACARERVLSRTCCPASTTLVPVLPHVGLLPATAAAIALGMGLLGPDASRVRPPIAPPTRGLFHPESLSFVADSVTFLLRQQGRLGNKLGEAMRCTGVIVAEQPVDPLGARTASLSERRVPLRGSLVGRARSRAGSLSSCAWRCRRSGRRQDRGRAKGPLGSAARCPLRSAWSGVGVALGSAARSGASDRLVAAASERRSPVAAGAPLTAGAGAGAVSAERAERTERRSGAVALGELAGEVAAAGGWSEVVRRRLDAIQRSRSSSA